MVRKTTKNNKDFIFKVILSALLTANVAISGVIAYNTAKIAKNTQTPSQIKHTISQIDVKPVLDSNEILYKITPIIEETPIISESNVNTDEPMDGLYIIESGDRLSELVNNWYGKYDYKVLMAFAKYNNIKNVDKIYTGDLLYIPPMAKLNEIITENNGFVVKTQTKPSPVAQSNNVVSTENKVISNESENKIVSNETKVVSDEAKVVSDEVRAVSDEVRVVSNETKDDIASLQSDITKTKKSVATNNARMLILKEDVNKTKKDISSLDAKVEENAENIDVVDKKLDAYINIEASEINIIEERLDTLEQSWVNGSLSIDEVLKRMSNIEQAIKDLSNNTISKEEAMSVIDNSGVKSELIPQEEAVLPVEEIQEPKAERISEDEIILPADEIQTPKSDFIPEEEAIIYEEDKNETLPMEEKITDVELPYIGTEAENEEVSQPQDDEEKMIFPFDEYQEPEEKFVPRGIFPPVNQQFVRDIPESIIAYTKTR